MEDVPEILVLFVLGIIFVMTIAYFIHPDVISGYALEIYNSVAHARNFLS